MKYTLVRLYVLETTSKIKVVTRSNDFLQGFKRKMLLDRTRLLGNVTQISTFFYLLHTRSICILIYIYIIWKYVYLKQFFTIAKLYYKTKCTLSVIFFKNLQISWSVGVLFWKAYPEALASAMVAMVRSRSSGARSARGGGRLTSEAFYHRSPAGCAQFWCFPHGNPRQPVR